jgi:hypothetical protein
LRPKVIPVTIVVPPTAKKKEAVKEPVPLRKKKSLNFKIQQIN